MEKHETFLNDAIEQYGKLQQETSELFKKHYVSIPYDLMKLNHKVKDGKRDVEKLLGRNRMVKFDAVITSRGTKLNSQNYVRIAKPADMHADDLGEGLFNSDEDKYVAYINATAEDYVLIDVPEGQSASINLLFTNYEKPLSSKILINVGPRAKLSLFEFCVSETDETSVLGLLHEVASGANAQIEISCLRNENEKTIALGYLKNRSGERSKLKFHSFYTGALQTRVRNRIEANDREAVVQANEIIFGSKDQKFDINTFIVNDAPDTNASLESKAALVDKSVCIMKGFAKIKKGASKARSYVHERGILLDKDAKVDGLPDMSVDENDVKATHSSATSPIDPEVIFYLMSKGVDEKLAKKLLVTGFFGGSISQIENDLMRNLSIALLEEKLSSKRFGMIPEVEDESWMMTSDVKESDIFKGHYKYRGA